MRAHLEGCPACHEGLRQPPRTRPERRVEQLSLPHWPACRAELSGAWLGARGPVLPTDSASPQRRIGGGKFGADRVAKCDGRLVRPAPDQEPPGGGPS
jgi:hypothetical protein